MRISVMTDLQKPKWNNKRAKQTDYGLTHARFLLRIFLASWKS